MMLVLSVFLLLYNLPRTTQDPCSVVRQQFQDMDLGKTGQVPFTLQKDHRGICASNTCCTTAMERTFRKRVRHDYGQVSRTHFDHIYESIKKKSEHFQMSIERYILHSARLSLQTCAVLTVDAPLTTTTLNHKKQSVLDVYGNITHYFRQVDSNKDVTIKKILKNFFKENIDAPKTKAPACLKDTAELLMRALDSAWLIKESLKFSRSLFGTVRSMRVSDDCTDALIQMNYCPLCEPNGLYQLTQPCLKYCINVHKGCLAPVLHLGPRITEWSRLLQTVLTGLRFDNSLLNAVYELDQLIHAILTSESVSEICEHKQHTYSDTASQTLDFHLEQLIKELTLFERVFDTLPYQLCDDNHQLGLGSDSYCWNGTAMSSYNCHVADNGLHSPNPTQLVMSDPMLDQQEARLKEIVNMLYEDTGVSPSPTPEIAIDYRDLCWDETDNTDPDGDDPFGNNLSDKRDHHSDNDTTPIPHLDERQSASPLLYISSVLLQAVLVWHVI